MRLIYNEAMIRGYGSKKPNRQHRREKRREIPFHRVSAEIKLEESEEVTASRVFLNDLSPAGVGCFVPMAIDKGQKVSMVIEQPKHLFVKGEVMWCTPYTLNTKVLSPEQFSYRIGIRFSFESDAEREAVATYCNDLYVKQRVKA